MSSGSVAYNPFYEPVVNQRYFARTRKYDTVSVARHDLAMMVDAFKERISNWYVEPTEVLLEKKLSTSIRRIVRWLTGRQDGGHYVFSVASTTCLLIDCLSQFRYGELTSDGRIFRKFVTDDLRSYKVTLPTSIWHYDDKHAPNGKELKEVADVLWSGFRCGFFASSSRPALLCRSAW